MTTVIIGGGCRERGDRGDKKTPEKFFKLIGKITQRSEAKMSENAARCRPGDRLGRPVCTTCTDTVRLTARSTVVKEQSPKQSTDWHELLSIGPNRPRTGSAGRPTDALCLS